MKDLKPLAENLDAEGKTLYQELLPWRWSPRENTRKLTHEVNYHVGYQTDQRSPGGGKSGSAGQK